MSEGVHVRHAARCMSQGMQVKYAMSEGMHC
jgi:hypothetical protein